MVEDKDIKPVSKMAFYCCGVRMQDAESGNPVCGDTYAKVFMNEDGMRILAAFGDETWPNASNVARHRIIDDLLRQELGMNPELQIILIGAGFDSRPYRLTGGKWIELDEPQIISYKNEQLALTDCKNELQRIPIDFATESLEQKLAPFSSTDPVLVVIEGVFIYLEEDAIRHLLMALRRLFARHKLICDLVNRRFIEKYSRTFYEKIAALGASFKIMENPDEIFIRHGYHPVGKISIVGRAIKWSASIIPEIFFHIFMPVLTQGYSINVFEAGAGDTG